VPVARRQPSHFRETFNRHFWITTSGKLLHPGADVLHHGNGVDRISVSGGLPFVPNPPETKWMEDLPLSLEAPDEDLSGNCKRLLEDVAALPLCGSFPKTRRAGRGAPGEPPSYARSSTRLAADGEFHDVQVPEHRYRRRRASAAPRRANAKGGRGRPQDNRDRQTELVFTTFLQQLRADPEWEAPTSDMII